MLLFNMHGFFGVCLRVFLVEAVLDGDKGYISGQENKKNAFSNGCIFYVVYISSQKLKDSWGKEKP